jgi:hypothetical protein
MLPFFFLTPDGYDERIFFEMTTTQFLIKYVSNDPAPSNRNGEVWTFDYTIWYDEGF